MKIGYVTAQTPWGQGESFVLPEILQLLQLGHEVIVYPLRPRRTIAAGAEPAEVAVHAVHLPLLDHRVVTLAVREALRSPSRAVRVLRSILCSSGGFAKTLKNLMVLPKGLALAYLTRTAGIQHIHAHWASTPSTAAYIAAKLTGIPWSLTAHRWDIAEANLIGEKARTASFIRAISERGARQLRTLLGGETWSKVKVVHMGVELPVPFPEGMEPSRIPTIVSVGNLIPVKGHTFLVEACSRLKERGLRFNCLIWGQGALESELRRRIMAAGLEDEVSLKGAIPHEKILESYRKREADLVVLPSIRTASGEEEGIPVALMEAMAAGIAVISTETGAIPELARDGAVELVPPGDPDALADAIERLLTDAIARRRLGEAGRRRVLAEFALPATVRELVRLFMARGVEG